MASIINYIGSLYDNDKANPTPPGFPTWDRNKGFSENLVKFPWEEQLRCCLDQLLAISYYLTFYGRGCHELVNEFIDEFMVDLKTRVIPAGTREYPTGPYRKIIDALVLMEKYCRTGRWDGDVDIDLVKDILTNHPFQATPTAWGNIFNRELSSTSFIPFLIYKNTHVNPTYTDYVCRDIGIPVFNFKTDTLYGNPFERDSELRLTLYTYVYPIGDSFHSKVTSIDKSGMCPLLAYTAKFNPGDRDFGCILGAIGASCLSLDVNNKETLSSQKLAATVAAILMGAGHVTGSANGFKPFGYDFDRGRYFNLLTEYLNHLHTTYGTAASSQFIVEKLFSWLATTEQQRAVVRFIRSHGESASAGHTSFSQEGLCIGIEALTFISQSPSLLSARSQVTGPSAEDKSEDAKSEQSSKQETKPDTKQENAKSDSSKKEDKKDDSSKEDSNKEDEKEADSTKDDDTSQDIGEDDTSGSDDTSDNTQLDSNDDTSSSGSVGESTPTDTPTPAEKDEPQVNTSDYAGFEFKTISPESETVDSVMFKEEMSSFLKNVLANPPDGLSPQNVAVLTALQRFWLHGLSIEAIVGIVGSCLKQLPESLIQLNTKLYGVKRQ